MTPSLSSDGTGVLSAAHAALTASPVERCTSRCTESAERLDKLARIVALVARLPVADAERARLFDAAVARLGE